jgi:hypothetical protein
MATWTGFGDNTELFWAVLSHSCTCKSARRTCSFLHSDFSHSVFRNGVFSEVYGRRVLRVFLRVEGAGRLGPIHIYSATPLCCASQTEVAEGLLLGG